MRKTIYFTVLTLLAAVIPASAGWEEGVAAYKSGSYANAAKEFQAIVQDRPDWAGGQFMLGLTLQKLNRDEDALNHLRKAYDLNPNDVSYQLALAKSYLDTAKYNNAVQLLDKINPSSLSKAQQTSYQQMKTVAYEKSGQDDRALESLAQMARQQPSNADIQYRYGLTAFNAGQTQQALAALDKAVNLDGSDVKKREAYVKVLIRTARTAGSQRKGYYERALPHARAAAQAQNSYDNLLTLGEVQLGAQRYQDAISTFKQAAGKSGSDWLVHYYTGQAETAVGAYQEAVVSLNQALAAVRGDKDRRTVWNQTGFVYEKLKDYSQAIDAYQKAGNSSGVERVQENQRIANENREIEAENARIEEMEAERKRLEEELKELPGGRPPL